MVLRETPQSRARVRVEASRSSGANTPDSMAARSDSAIWR